MKRTIWCAAVVVLAACNEGSIAGPEAQYGRTPTTPTANPQLVVAVGGNVTYRQSGASRTGVGVCLAGGQWQNTAKNYTTTAGHPNCADVVGGAAVQVALKLGKVGDATQYSDNDGYIWYRKAPDVTQGDGVFHSTTGGWSVEGVQALLNNRGLFVNRGGMVVQACNTSGCHPAVLSW